MTEQRLAEIEAAYLERTRLIEGISVQELIDEVRFLQAALADARKELDATQKELIVLRFACDISEESARPFIR